MKKIYCSESNTALTYLVISNQ